jgi:hypothetical protein
MTRDEALREFERFVALNSARHDAKLAARLKAAKSDEEKRAIAIDWCAARRKPPVALIAWLREAT